MKTSIFPPKRIIFVSSLDNLSNSNNIVEIKSPPLLNDIGNIYREHIPLVKNRYDPKETIMDPKETVANEEWIWFKRNSR
jgi:hypothetical protein